MQTIPRDAIAAKRLLIYLQKKTVSEIHEKSYIRIRWIFLDSSFISFKFVTQYTYIYETYTIHCTIAGTVLCFGGGVLLGTVFMHMLKEVRESMERAVSMGFFIEIEEYPFSELLICLGK